MPLGLLLCGGLGVQVLYIHQDMITEVQKKKRNPDASIYNVLTLP